PELAKHHIPCSLTLVDSPGGKLEAAAIIEESAAILHKAGVKLAINTDDFITDSRIFLRTASAAVRSGIPDEEVLKAVTLNPAEMLHLEGRIGSLEKGKDADFVVLSGPPFSSYTHVLETYIDGRRVFDRANPRDHAYQTGGFALTDPGRLPALAKDAAPLEPVAIPAATSGGSAATPSKRLVISAGRIHTATHGTIVDGVIVIEDGKIQSIGRRSDVTIPEGTRILTAADVTPGLIDANTVAGLS